ncbi:histone-lysine N-methyltransferase SETMAR [Elysia marginata]|uniref:Histone-lysine N-methyltransferase SETMAR n=1 Tax=Elysia marginata TaxID=1093978 RepID=A0AAV4GE22_9GAST|nr:histone-lysine N-methyltransferase SETMAR [Elysia marginata]
MLPNTATLLTASEMQFVAKDLDSLEGVLCFSTIMRPLIQQTLHSNTAARRWEILPHPAHSPDLAPSDFCLFGPLKLHLGGMTFETQGDLVGELKNWFAPLDLDFFRGYLFASVALENA